MKTLRTFIRTVSLTMALSMLLLPPNGMPAFGWLHGMGSRAAYAAPLTWDISTGDLLVSSGGEYTVTGSTTTYTIAVNTLDPVTLFLDQVSIDVSAASGKTAFDSGGNVTLYLTGPNTLKSSASQPGIRVTGGEQLTVSNAASSEGSLSASGGAFGAGIGGGFMQNGGALTIVSGSVSAYGGDFAAGIGGAYTGSGGAVTITGGTVTAQGGVRAAGIGGGIGGSGGEVVITGGSVKAGGVRSNIGAGYNGSHDGTLTNGFAPVALSIVADAVAAVDPIPVSYQIPVSGSNPDNSYVYTYTGAGHGGGDTNLYFYLPPADLPAPSAPTGLTATPISYSQINLTWVENDAGEQGFKIERCAGAGCSDFAQIATVGANVTGYVNTGLSGSTSYSYRVRAYNAAGDSSYSNPASALTPAAQALPATPANLAAAGVSGSRVNLSWTDLANNETGFRIQRCTGSNCTSFVVIATVGANVTIYANTGLAANTVYRYRVYAYNASGSSGYSNVAAARTRRR